MKKFISTLLILVITCRAFAQDTTFKSHAYWDSLGTEMQVKYGMLGKEKLNGYKMLYYLQRKEWKEYGKYYKKYFKTAYAHSEWHINNFSWKIFKYVDDRSVLKVAVNTMRYEIEKISVNDSDAYDTYANLLHKVGRTTEAIAIQEKAVQMDPGSEWKTKALAKMKSGLPTW